MRRKKFVLGIYGAGSLGIEVLHLIQSPSLCHEFNKFEIFFIDDNLVSEPLHGISVINREEFFSKKATKHFFIIAIADTSARKRIALELLATEAQLINVVSQNISFLGKIEVGRGLILFPNINFSNNVVIGDFVIVNSQSYIGHDVSIGSFSTISPGVNICGHVEIAQEVFIGAGASIKQGNSTSFTRIGEGSLIGMGSVVVSNVPRNTKVVGNPARKLEKSEY